MKPALFSANSEGACPTCNGAGVIYTDLAMMAGVATICEECEGRRFQASVLEYHLGGRNISEVLAMSVAEAETFFGAGDARTPAAHTILARLVDVGLGYITLGQPLPTLSGGERQRLKLATHMGEKGGVYILDEPTSGLHLADVQNLLGLLDRLVDSGKTVIVIEHHQAVMAHGDWIIDLGPGPATTVAGSCSRARPPTSWPTARRSPGSISRPTSAADPRACSRSGLERLERRTLLLDGRPIAGADRPRTGRRRSGRPHRPRRDDPPVDEHGPDRERVARGEDPRPVLLGHEAGPPAWTSRLASQCGRNRTGAGVSGSGSGASGRSRRGRPSSSRCSTSVTPRRLAQRGDREARPRRDVAPRRRPEGAAGRP